MGLIHQIALTFIKGVGPVTAKALLKKFGTAEAVFSADRYELLQTEGIGLLTASNILNKQSLALAEEQLKFVTANQISILFYTDDQYPRRLRECIDAPVVLYYKGTADLNHSRIVSVVGTRNATTYGLMICRQLVETLKLYDVMIISGLAYGIDVAAHRASLSMEIPTVGVLAHGFDRLYPASHREVATEMLNKGGILTEFPMYTIPEKGNFPKRNRIIAGLADVTIVVEAALKGGALITADIADSYNREVFAFPGRNNDLYSQGCNFLIRTNRASLLTHARDLVYHMGWEVTKPIDTAPALKLPSGLPTRELKILEMLQGGAMPFDEIVIKAELPQSILALCLLNLELQGLIISGPGMVYQLVFQ